MSSAGYVLDASALLCLLNGEPGGDRVEALLGSARISAVNLAEVLSKLVDKGVEAGAAATKLRQIGVEIAPFDQAGAEAVGGLRALTRSAGLSLGDRACLALAGELGATAVTSDRLWATLRVGVEVELIR